MATLGLNASSFNSNLEAAQSHAKSAGGAMSDAFGGLGERLGAFASLAFVEETIRHTVEWGEKIMVLSERLGMSTDSIQQWDYALKLNGSSIDEATGFFEKLSTAQMKIIHGADGGDKMAAAFKRLGVSIDDIKSKRVEEIAETIAKTLQGGDVEQLKGDLRAVGGRAAGAMVPTLLNIEDKGKAPLAAEETILALHEIAQEAKTVWTAITTSFAVGISAIHTILFGATAAFVAAGSGLVTYFKEIFELVSHPTKLMNLSLTNNPLVNAGKTLIETFDEAMSGRALKVQDELDKMHKSQKAGGPGEIEISEGHALKQAKEIAALKEQTLRVSMATALAEMSAGERVLALQRAIAGLKEDIAGGSEGENEKAKMGLELAKLESDLSKAKKEADREERKENRFHAAHVSERQRIGAFVSPHEQDGANIARKSQGHLANIEKHMARLVGEQRQEKF